MKPKLLRALAYSIALSSPLVLYVVFDSQDVQIGYIAGMVTFLTCEFLKTLANYVEQE